MFEIRLHGRGGQGVVMASEILVAAAVLEGKYGNAIPFFGFERRGAPLSAFVRLDSRPIRERTQVYNPDCLVVMDPTLLQSGSILTGLKPGGIVVINSPAAPPEAIPPEVCKLGTVDATGIALKTIGAPVTNSAMLGAFAASTGLINMESIISCLDQFLPPHAVEPNKAMIKEAFQQTRIHTRGAEFA